MGIVVACKNGSSGHGKLVLCQGVQMAKAGVLQETHGNECC